jgi:Pectate lyase superfamily protein
MQGGLSSPAGNLSAYVYLSDYGAVGDGIADDTQAFLDAVNAVGDGTIYLPGGTFRITQMINITNAVFFQVITENAWDTIGSNLAHRRGHLVPLWRTE